MKKHFENWSIKTENNSEDIKNLLPNNSDDFKIVILDKVNDSKNITDNNIFKIRSNDDFFEYIKLCAKNYVSIKTLKAGGKIPKFTDIDIYNIIMNYNLVKIRTVITEVQTKTIKEVTLWHKDYDDITGMYVEIDIPEFIMVINSVLQISNYAKLKSNVTKLLTDTTERVIKLQPLKLAPDYIVLTKNGVFNKNTFEFSQDINYFGDYDFINKFDIRLLPPCFTEKYYNELHDRIFGDWTEGDAQKIIYLKQLLICAMTGDGHGVLNILIGGGGNGKSSYINYIRLFSSGYYATLNAHEIGDDNKLEDIGPTTRAVFGHELSTNAKFTGDTLSRLKQFITADPFKINIKYKPSRIFQTNALKIQATNTMPKVFDNNPAISRRLRFFQWTNVDFSQFVEKIDLNEESKNPAFLESLCAFVFSNIKPFTDLIKIKEMTDLTKDMMQGSDQVFQFLDWMQVQQLLVGIIPSNVMYQMYRYWSITENGGVAMLKAKDVTERIVKLLEQYPQIPLKYHKKQIKLSSLSKKDININVLNKYYFEDKINVNKYNNTTYFECMTKIKNKEIELFSDALVNNEIEKVDSYKGFMILDVLVDKMNDDAIKFKSLMEDTEY